MGKLGDLPEEVLVTEIMSRLPQESLPNLKLVKKSWYSLIKDFVRTNLDKKSSLLVFEGVHDIENDPKQGEEFSLKIFDSENEKANNSANLLGSKFKPFQRRQKGKGGKIFLAGYHCDGIICLVNMSRGNILLLNPLTKRGKCLPKKNVHLSPNDSDQILRVGFGYDDIEDVYKVVKICGFIRSFRAHVYTLGDDDGEKKPVWRDIPLQINTNDFCLPTRKELYCRGSYYWLVTRTKGNNVLEEALHSFDMHSEEFRVVPLPKGFPYLESYYVSYLTEWNESVALLCHTSPKELIHMWVMDNHDQTWTKHQSITLEIDILINHSVLDPSVWPIGFLDTHRILLRLRSEGRHCVVSYDILTHEVSLIYEAPTQFFRLFHYGDSPTPD